MFIIMSTLVTVLQIYTYINYIAVIGINSPTCRKTNQSIKYIIPIYILQLI